MFKYLYTRYSISRCKCIITYIPWVSIIYSKIRCIYFIIN
nr:MAG TPA: hypothetical protein [Caudoviricetes sp.]